MPKILRSLAGKLALTQTAFLVVALLSVALALWMARQLEGGAGAINEAGRMRMASYRMALLHNRGDGTRLTQDIAGFDTMLLALRQGDPKRPLFIPQTEACLSRLAQVESLWPRYRGSLLAAGSDAALQDQAEQLVLAVDALVGSIEQRMAERTALLGGVCAALVGLLLLGGLGSLASAYAWILKPLQSLRTGLATMAAQDFTPRLAQDQAAEEFRELALGFNRMADALDRSYQDLAAKVQEKTAGLALQHQRLAALYELAQGGRRGGEQPEALAQGFADQLRRLTGADAVALRLSSSGGERLLLLGQTGLPAALEQAGHEGVESGCACSTPAQAGAQARALQLDEICPRLRDACAAEGFSTLVRVPMWAPGGTAVGQDPTPGVGAADGPAGALGQVDLFFRSPRALPADEADWLDALAAQLATRFDHLRLASRDREAAISEERQLLAQELHDSIAQSLAFMKMQVQLLRQALARGREAEVQLALAEIDTGVRESYADVRELLLHFRTRPADGDIEHALRSTLSKFRVQSGLDAQLDIDGQGLPLPPDAQVQVLHVVQEALSNVRKHAAAAHVVVSVQRAPRWRFEIRDDGRGFARTEPFEDSTQVGLRIMHERAQRIGATLDIASRPGRGTCVSLMLAATPPNAS